MSMPDMVQCPGSLEAFTAAASAAANTNGIPYAAGAATDPATGHGSNDGHSGKGNGGGGRRNARSSDAESEQACAPFTNVGPFSSTGGIPALRPVGMPGGSSGSMGSSKAGSLKGGRRSIDITVDASPLVSWSHDSSAQIPAVPSNSWL
jgi:hypothetical protein